MTPEWSVESTTQLRALVADGLSAGKISDIMDISRNAVAGKAHRLGIKLLGQDRKPRKVAATPARPAGASNNDRKVTQTIKRVAAKPAAPAPILEVTEAVDPPPEVVPADQRKTLHELTAETCRWPIGDPMHADFHFCGASPKGGAPYCASHSRMAYETHAQRQARLAAWRAANPQKVRAA